MKTKLEEAAEATAYYINKDEDYSGDIVYKIHVGAYKDGAKWQSEQSNQVIQELVQALIQLKERFKNTNPIMVNSHEYKVSEELIQKHTPKQ